ncbi:hypothetical protein TWF102_007562 [Orbilia oligospora]|uniref:Uncharacterized protein n=1 Tax=Orbilia oligospora TaxID=2813651 RepID=A0A7C8N302_ORBOL|nr:hypothetical protein TWF102_007562 [Orbilia oligospora]
MRSTANDVAGAQLHNYRNHNAVHCHEIKRDHSKNIPLRRHCYPSDSGDAGKLLTSTRVLTYQSGGFMVAS